MKWFTTPYGRKNLEALTGTALLAFLIEHLAANILLLLNDPSWYQWYTNTLGHSLIVRGLEAVLFATFAIHIGIGLMMRMQYRRMMAKNPRAKRPKDYTSRFVGLTGIIILIFLIIHLWHFFIPNRILVTKDLDLYHQAQSSFSSLWYTLFYVACMVALAMHLKHGIRSALFSFKFIKPSLVPRIRNVVMVVGLLTPLGLAYIAVHIFVRSLLVG